MGGPFLWLGVIFDSDRLTELEFRAEGEEGYSRRGIGRGLMMVLS